MKKELIILGAGGHAKVVIETARMCGFYPCAVFDDNDKLTGDNVLGVPIKGRIADLPDDLAGDAFVAIGNTKIRKNISQRLFNVCWPILIHPFSYISSAAIISAGSIICAGSVIQPDAIIGKHVIISTGSNIDHDCLIGDFAHICPGCNLAGASVVGEGAMLGTGSSIIPLKHVGAWSVIGAGAAVVADIPAETVAVV